MNLEYLLLPLGVVLLVIPTAVICGPRMRTKLDQPARRRNEGLVSLVRSRINWIDLLRGAAGAWLVQKPFQDSISSQDELATTFLIVQLLALFAGVLAQTLWIRKPIRVIGPVFFLTGITLAISGALSGGFALVLGLSCALMIGRLSMVFSLVPAALIGFGLLFQEFSVMTAFNAAAYALPAFLAFTFGTRISFVRSTARIRGLRARSVSLGHTENLKEEDTVLRPDFAHPPAPDPVPTPAPARLVAGERAPLPDFLRLAEDPEPSRRPVRNRLFPRRGA
jgi:hypothetical protein